MLESQISPWQDKGSSVVLDVLGSILLPMLKNFEILSKFSLPLKPSYQITTRVDEKPHVGAVHEPVHNTSNAF